MEPSRLPFSLSGLYGGCAKLDGLVILSPEHLTLEYRAIAMFGVWNGRVNTRTIGWKDLERAECGRGFFAPWLTLTARTLSAFDTLPCANSFQLKLAVPWKYRRLLRSLTSEINLHLSFREADRLRDRSFGSGGGQLSI